MKAGAWDYVIKENLALLGPAIRYALNRREILIEKDAAEKALRESEERYRGVFEHTGAATILLDENGTILSANRECQSMMGYAPEDLLGTHWSDYVAPESLRALHEHGRSGVARSVRMPGRYEACLVDSQGRTRHCLLSVGTIPTARQFVVSVLDITDRVQAEEERRLLATTIEHTMDAVFIADSQNRILYANKGFEMIYGFSRKEVLGKTPGLLKSGRHDPAFYEHLKAVLNACEPWRGLLINRKKDGSHVEVFATITPICDSEGMVTHFASVHRDITREREIERRVEQHQRLEAIGTLAGGIAHDFNNYLTPIMGYAELCLGLAPADSKLKEYLERIVQAANRSSELVKQILSFSRQSAHERRPLNLAPIVKEALKLLRAAIPSTVEIRQEIEPVEYSVHANPIEIHQVVVNLCTNAYQAMPDGGELTVGLQVVDVDRDFAEAHPNLSAGKHVRLTVRDTGVGIPDEIVDKVFEPYFTTKGEEQGTGLGLAVVHGIVASCGGAVTVYSELGVGTEFNVYLPALTAAPEEIRPDGPPVQGGNERILFVDDEPVVTELGVSTLERHGYVVTGSTQPTEALELVQDDPAAFDLVITDMTMRGMTGDRLAAAILELRPDMPIILCTGFSERVDGEKARQLGIKKLLNKPFSPYELAKAVRDLLDQEK
jgi:PAS domain S-box-containing protein